MTGIPGTKPIKWRCLVRAEKCNGKVLGSESISPNIGVKTPKQIRVFGCEPINPPPKNNPRISRWGYPLILTYLCFLANA